jgi:6-phosphofructokinase
VPRSVAHAAPNAEPRDAHDTAEPRCRARTTTPVSWYAAQMTNVVEFGLPKEVSHAERRLLVVFDGGNAPGYSSVAVALTEEGVRRGYEVWAATEGFRSLTADATSEPRFERLIVGRAERYALLAQGIPTRSMGRRVLDAGSDFRSERYAGFLDRAPRLHAAETIRAQGFTHVVAVGGNGTFEGIKALHAELDPKPLVGFINVSVDNDLGGDRAIGFLSGVEAGATIARGLYEDAYTHKRIYLLEMMGNRGGRHVLHCGVAARAHLVILPFFHFPADVLEEIAGALGKADHALVVIAEGYERDRRKREAPHTSASEYFRKQLEGAGLRDSSKKRVIAEPFSRYLRGVRPAFLDVSAAYLKASLLFSAFEEQKSLIMPYVLAANDVGLRGFDEVAREDGVEPAFLPLLERFELPRFRAWVRDHYAFGAG